MVKRDWRYWRNLSLFGFCALAIGVLGTLTYLIYQGAMTFVHPGEHSFGDPEMMWWMECEAEATLMREARDEGEYMECSSNLSQAEVERRYWQREMERPSRFPPCGNAGDGLLWLEPDPVESEP